MVQSTAKLKIFASMFIFGTIGIFVNYIPLPRELIALSRGIIGAVFLLIAVLIKGQKPDWNQIQKNLLWLVLSGTALGFNWLLLFESYRFTSVAIGTLCYYMAPIFIVLVSPFLLKEKLTIKKSVCVALALFGMVCISKVLTGGLPPVSELKGILLGLAAAVLYASIVLMNKKIVGVSAYDKTIIQLLISAVTLLPYIFLKTDFSSISLSGRSLTMLILVGVIHTGLAYYLYFGSMEHVSGQTAAMISYVDPAIAVLASVLILGEAMTMIEVLGAILIIGAALMSEMNVKTKGTGNPSALLPVGIFLILYLGLGLILEYVLGINQGFYKIPIVVIFLIALLVACLQNRKKSFDQKLETMAKGVGDKDIMTMILIFLVAGVFVGVTGKSSAEAVAYFLLSVTPPWAAVAILFVAACFVSIAMGTSVGTITLIAPIAVNVSAVSGFSLPLCIASVMGGAMFGDNLSFISDTTIAACNTQNCPMKDKFRANFKIALPAALVTLAIILLVSDNNGQQIVCPDYNLWLLIPYVLVLIGGIIGINVFAVLLIGIASSAVIVLATGTSDGLALLESVGSGVSEMFTTILVTILVSAMCGLIRENGGFDALLGFIHKVFKGRIGGRLGVGLLVGAMDVATANNTVAIVMAGPIAKQMSSEYGISPRETASLLDTFSCIFQGIIPYGAQMLVAISVAEGVTAFEIIPYLFYPFLLCISSLFFIILGGIRKK